MRSNHRLHRSAFMLSGPTSHACFLAIGLVLAAMPSGNALEITTGPTVTLSANSPLAALLALTTDDEARVSVLVNNGTSTWERHLPGFRKVHTLPLLGFKPGLTNAITVTVYDRAGNSATNAQPLTLITKPLPSDFPKLALRASQPERMEPGYTLFRLQNNSPVKAYVTIVDPRGEVVWYSTVAATLDVRQLPNGNLFIPQTGKFAEINLLGQTVKSWAAPIGWAIDFHDGVPTDHGTILYINGASRTVAGFPTSATDPQAPRATTNLLYNRIVELSVTNATVLKSWSLIDMLDPLRINYLTFTIKSGLGWDCEHANAVIEDPRDDSIIVSMRHQDAVIKFSRADGQLKWILGPHENWGEAFQRFLLKPVGAPFAWNYAQHAPMITPQGTLLLYDNGNFRASPFDSGVENRDNYTRAVEFQIDEANMEVRQVWDYGRDNCAERMFTDRVGNADWLPLTGNVLVTFGNINYLDGQRPSPYSTNATMLRIQEVTHEQVPEVVFDLVAFDAGNTNANYRGCFAYRSHRIRDLYPAEPVSDLSARFSAEGARLSFSGDPVRKYLIQASADLIRWEPLGMGETEGDGFFYFDDSEAGQPAARYYRVMTE